MASEKQVRSNENKGAKQPSLPPIPEQNNLTQEQFNPELLAQQIRIDSDSVTPAEAGYLQRTVGNQAVGHLLNSGIVEKAPTNPTQIASAAETSLQSILANRDTIYRTSVEDHTHQHTKPQTIHHPSSENTLQRQSETNKKNDTGLPNNLKTGIENLSGYTMDDVKVHYHSDKPAQVQAHAYTQGTDIHVAPGQERHLPHEAWHVVQQKQGRVKSTMQLKGKVGINDDEQLEKEATLMGEKASQNTVSIPQPVKHKSSHISGDNPIQMMRVMRWMNAKNKDDYISKLAKADPERYKILYEQIIKGGRKALIKYLDLHGQGLLGNDSPFVSVGLNPYSLSWGSDTSEGGVDIILQNTPHTVWFDVPNDYLFPGMTELSQSETELLVLLPPGQTLASYIATINDRPGIEPNRWQGMSTEERQQALKEANPEFTRLVVRLTEEHEPGPFHVSQEDTAPPWTKKSKTSLKFSELPKTIQERIQNLAAENWPQGSKKFNQGLQQGEDWATNHLQTTIDDNIQAIQKALKEASSSQSSGQHSHSKRTVSLDGNRLFENFIPDLRGGVNRLNNYQAEELIRLLGSDPSGQSIWLGGVEYRIWCSKDRRKPTKGNPNGLILGLTIRTRGG